jgi:hypothetical protein
MHIINIFIKYYKPTWCSHCGGMSGPGQRVNKCAESNCNKSAHRDCTPMVPHFCGLSPDMALQLVQAFEHQQAVQAKHEAEMAEKAEKDRIEKELSNIETAGGPPPFAVNPFESSKLMQFHKFSSFLIN